MIDHDAQPGPLARCQICGNDNLKPVIDLGHQPPCDALLTVEQLFDPEMTYPLRLIQCPECTLAQLDYVVPAEKVYPREYPYRAGISWPVVKAHEEMARSLVNRFRAGFCVDIGSNDGTLLTQLRGMGCTVLGIEPTDIAQLASVPTRQSFFGEIVARQIAAEHGRAHLITMTNVFAHMANLGEVMRGIEALLAREGVLVIENHYLLDVLEKNQFDTIYHEHIRTYSLRSLMVLFEQYGMEVFDAERHPRYGGNIRVYVARKGMQRVWPRVNELLVRERAAALGEPATWAAFRERVLDARDMFMSFLHSAHRSGESVVGCSAPGRASSLLNFYGVTPDLMPYLGEIEGSLKIGKYVPGCHVPVVANKRIAKEQPDYVVLLAWHYAEPIIERLKREGVRSKLIVPLPEFKVVE